MFFDQKFQAKHAVLAAFGLVAILSGCSSHLSGEGYFDPYEQTNRKVHAFNKGLDKNLLRPVANTYDVILPDPVEKGVSNFASNLSLPGKVVNHVLQGDLEGAGQNTARFLLNSTFGLGGLFDTSSEWGAPEVDTDFGATLSVWGVGEGAYVELPVFGPSNERDAVGTIVDMVMDPVGFALEKPASTVRTATRVGEILETRHQLGAQIDGILYESADSYAQSRLIYLQNRRFELEGDTGDSFIDPYIDPYEDFE